MNNKLNKINNLIWDLSGTLFKPNGENFLPDKIPTLSLLLYLWSGKKTMTKYDKIALEILHKAKEQSNQYKEVKLHTGKQVPEVICLWLAGIISRKKAIEYTIKYYNFYINKSNLANEEKELIKDNLYTFFDPKSLALSMHPIKEIKELLALCVKKSSCSLYVLSNWDIESFLILYKSSQGQEVLSYFDLKNILISSETGFVKPQLGIYKYFINHYNIKPKQTIFIDDQIENLEAAQKFDIIPIHFKNNNAEKVKAELERFGIFNS